MLNMTSQSGRRESITLGDDGELTFLQAGWAICSRCPSTNPDNVGLFQACGSTRPPAHLLARPLAYAPASPHDHTQPLQTLKVSAEASGPQRVETRPVHRLLPNYNTIHC